MPHFNLPITSVVDPTVPAPTNAFFRAGAPDSPGVPATVSPGVCVIDASQIPSWNLAPLGGVAAGYTAGDVPLIKVIIGAQRYCVVLTAGGALAVRTVSQ